MPKTLSLTILLVLTGSIATQPPPGQRLPGQLVAPAKTLAVRLNLGDQALANADHKEAVGHFLSALTISPANVRALRGLLAASQDQPEDRNLWSIRFYMANLDDRGRAKLDKATRALMPGKPSEDPDYAVLGAARFAAIQELARFASRLKTKGRRQEANGMMARWCSDLAWKLLKDAPGMRPTFAPQFHAACDQQKPDYQFVLKALRRVMTSYAAKAKTVPEKEGELPFATDPSWDIAMRAARILSGLAAQANFKKLKGPQPPDVGKFQDAARALRGKLREKLKTAGLTPLTVAQLQAMTSEQRAQFTRTHSTWANPGVAISPNGRYVIQTSCGHSTLLGLARTIEHHHDRLASWFAGDPFKKRPGIVRVVPESDGLEAEDSPFWWAGGFQRGDLTTVKFTWGNIVGLGRGITHELTHRFDGAFHAFIPAWLSEGRAVWTSQAYGRIRDKQFAKRFFRLRSMQTVFLKRYGTPRELKKLLTGTIDDYRDNYSAGYALFGYLQSWKKGGKLLFAGRLKNFMTKGRAGRNKPVEWFVANFADGKDGRPNGFDAFAKMFGDFLHGCYRYSWGEKVAWLPGDYVEGLPGERSNLVMDEPTWSWQRNRAEPWFGQDHAAAAGSLFAEVGMNAEAIAALCWSLQTDGWHVTTGTLLRDQMAKAGMKDGAWLAGYETLRRFEPEKLSSIGQSPFLAKLPKTANLLQALRKSSAACLTRKMPSATRVLMLDHNELARHVGAVPLLLPSNSESRSSRYPLRGLDHPLGHFGWVDDFLTGYEERRVSGLWYENDDGDLHIGRKKPKKNTGLTDRRAHQRHVFVRAAEWQEPGLYAFKTRVHFTTSFVSGAIVFGHSRRDRNVRLRFRAGDFLYSIGRSDKVRDMDAVAVWIDGLWQRDNKFWGNLARQNFKFEKPTTSFDLEVLVSGPTMFVTIDKQLALTYCTPDGSPIAGHLGVAMGQGAIRLQEPRVRRLDHGGMRGPANDPGRGLGLGKGDVEETSSLLRRITRGLPKSPNGSIVVWMPFPEDFEVEESMADLRDCVDHAKKLLARPLHYPQKWVVAVPKNIPDSETKKLEQHLEKLAPKRFSILRHEWKGPFALAPWALFVDARGVLRTTGIMNIHGPFPRSVEAWARLYRGPSERRLPVTTR